MGLDRGKACGLTGTYQGAFLIAFLLLMSASFLSFLVQETRYREAVPVGG
ncbi:MAG: hypothetical protein ACE5JS_08265 [Nitrospinota bacterium]